MGGWDWSSCSSDTPDPHQNRLHSQMPCCTPDLGPHTPHFHTGTSVSGISLGHLQNKQCLHFSIIEQILVWSLELISNVHSHPDSSLSSLQSFTPSHLHVVAMHWVLDAHDHWNSPHFSGVTLQFYTGREVVVCLYGADGYLAIMLNLLNTSTCTPTLFEIHLY